MGLEIWFKDDLLKLLIALYHANVIAGAQPHTDREQARVEGYAAALQGIALAIGVSGQQWQDTARGMLRQNEEVARYALSSGGR